MWLYFGLSTGFVYEGFFFWRISIREITSWLQVINCGCRMAFFVGYQLEGWFFRSPKFRRFSIKSGSLKTEQFNCPVLHKRYFCNSQHSHNEDGVAEMPMVRCESWNCCQFSLHCHLSAGDTLFDIMKASFRSSLLSAYYNSVTESSWMLWNDLFQGLVYRGIFFQDHLQLQALPLLQNSTLHRSPHGPTLF